MSQGGRQAPDPPSEPARAELSRLGLPGASRALRQQRDPRRARLAAGGHARGDGARRHRRRGAATTSADGCGRTRMVGQRRHGTVPRRGRDERGRGRLPRQPVPEGQPQLHPARDPGAGAAGRVGDALRVARLGRRRHRRRPTCSEQRAHALRAAGGGACRSRAAVAAALLARAGALRRARSRSPCAWRGAPTAPVAYHLVYLAEACRLLRVAARRRASATCTRTSAPTRPRSRCSSHALGGPPYSFTVHGPEEFDTPAGAAACARRSRARPSSSRSARSGAASSIAGSPPAHWPKVKSCTAGSTRPSMRRRRAVAGERRAPGLRRPAVRAEGPAAAARGGRTTWSRAAVRSSWCWPATARCAPTIEALIDALGLRDARAHHRLDRRRAGARRDPRRARAGAAELRRGLAGRDHGGDGAAPAGDHHLRRRHPRAGAPRRGRLAGSGRRRRRAGRRDRACLDAPRRCAGAHGRRRARPRAGAASIDVEAAKLAALFAQPRPARCRRCRDGIALRSSAVSCCAAAAGAARAGRGAAAAGPRRAPRRRRRRRRSGARRRPTHRRADAGARRGRRASPRRSAAVLPQLRRGDRLLVVADNCSDDTAAHRRGGRRRGRRAPRRRAARQGLCARPRRAPPGGRRRRRWWSSSTPTAWSHAGSVERLARELRCAGPAGAGALPDARAAAAPG